eukprot:jgi/Antlo1/2603/1479
MSTMSSYDDVSVFTPEGKVKPLDYIKSTVELGNTTVALSNVRTGVIVVHTGPVVSNAFPTQKLFQISDFAAFAFSGMTNDGLEIVSYLVDEVIWHETYKNQPVHHLQLFENLSFDAAYRTVTSNKRLYGAGGVLMIRTDGVKLVEFEPTGIVQVAKAVSVGSRSQSAKTILENYVNNFENMDKEQLIRVGLEALKNAHPDERLCKENIEIWCLENSIEVVDARHFV